MPDEIALAIATALATKGTEAAVAEGRTALAALARTILDRFRRGSREADALQEAAARPGDRERQLVLAELLSRALADDPRFAGRVLTQWRAVQEELTLDRGAVSNHFSGAADKVVQARDIHGDITL
ncbi:hypothetical protein GCM10010399_05250 [Dactylosporangium fulvum]|uniref:Chorismate mutase n=1 Tax=Dactylosporangium fulvum TaxID=53359 RepID=A0ABY5VX02_9ACTN|nr:hypothetical protein [Dactylosporangium fulvum]UWP81376.1 hypothetical protein Dfulv_40670 [Dactylosporangium fulvum]